MREGSEAPPAVGRDCKDRGHRLHLFWNIGAAFRGQEVALREAGGGRWEVYYCWKKIGVADFGVREGKPKGRYEQLTERRVGRRGSVNDVPEQV